jgi:hypothetical protein
MYWRIRKITPDLVVKRYGVYAVLIVSLLANIGLYTRVSTAQGMSSVQKTDYDRFARQVTQHLFDATYLTVEDSMLALNNELGPVAQQKLRQSEIIPKSDEDMHAISRQLADTKSVSSVKFDNCTVGDPLTQGNYKGMLPVDLKVEVLVHDTDGVRPTNLKLRYYMGMATNPKTKESRPIVVDLEQQADQGTANPS